MTDVSFLDELELDGTIATGDSARKNHAGDWMTADEEMVYPSAVVWAESTADVSAVLAAATEQNISVTPYAAGTGLEGGAVPTNGGISLDMTRLDAIVAFSPADLQIEVEAGVIGSTVDEAVAGDGLFFPPLPTSGDISTIGGMIATDASGMQTVKYGEVADWILGLEAVLPDGRIIRTGSRAMKSSSGYNLTDVLIGSEGTLAVVTKATLQLAGRPQEIRCGRAMFPSLDHAATAVADVVTSGVDVAKIELIDETCAAMANAYGDRELPISPMVFLEFHADHGVDQEVSFCRTIFDSHGVNSFETGDESDMDTLWKARKDLGEGAMDKYDPKRVQFHPGDVTVPLSKYAEGIRLVQQLEREYGLKMAVFGHAGDGNIHYVTLVDMDNPAERAAAEEMYEAMIEFAVECGGTVTGEHGIGRGKRQYLREEHGEAVEVMHAIKMAFDPENTLNPGTVFPDSLSNTRAQDE